MLWSGTFSFAVPRVEPDGGWVAPYFDEVYGKVMEKQMKPADLLLGRKTFEIFANYWPKHENDWPGINDVTTRFQQHLP
jgi:dihydrofolate reductase